MRMQKQNIVVNRCPQWKYWNVSAHSALSWCYYKPCCVQAVSIPGLPSSPSLPCKKSVWSAGNCIGKEHPAIVCKTEIKTCTRMWFHSLTVFNSSRSLTLEIELARKSKNSRHCNSCKFSVCIQEKSQLSAKVGLAKQNDMKSLPIFLIRLKDKSSLFNATSCSSPEMAAIYRWTQQCHWRWIHGKGPEDLAKFTSFRLKQRSTKEKHVFKFVIRCKPAVFCGLFKSIGMICFACTNNRST